MIDLKRRKLWEEVKGKVCFTNGPLAMEQTDDGTFGVENSIEEEIVERRKFSILFVVDGWIDGVRDRCFCSFDAAKFIWWGVFWNEKRRVYTLNDNLYLFITFFQFLILLSKLTDIKW